VLAALAVPFAVTGVYRVFRPDFLPLPFVLIGLCGTAMLAQYRVRTIGVGLLVGTVVCALALLYLLMSWGSALREFGS
jgi:uncharacterized membrane-anchored protein